ncbi:3-hydroxy-2-methylbutyryl-CoA dehydrogenase [Sphingomonas melonis TY]|jgi:NAD(P)-dependent dehydrogenase (short-subunit alcohol dehydrogenase family)|uniref:3-hydroxy-2-methylbutyryl-CoA dehydrogenase n=1 Tax=Sphingomonas melonis TY TaxID=621456 RepID=A0A175Y6E7_9SPHN|nr:MULTISPECIES: SDR family NAD(P)-dependent oxidoreductase [Sphingomonas]AOW24914.1 3-hydroxyacyl-CoA dehydrogenase [Sphingomonas melonis TY]ATI56963.1 3-hydroxyacyl-CoA dehydrogenase [Sphingomonas melonis]KZB96233.1 3-hydroxy-2-methylbutyryl-CoA dehydrogenase [Sphingomonas melonis TY]MBI0532975.1 SDR family NAD(P)-dependent oxidoreductase [Sphingomonas sp. TX0522]MBX8845618.1 SDR family NAD(P)-dependent oxidoreductase [Sphingomonas melonis]
MNIDGIAAIVTGGASGLGGGSAKRLAAQGAKVTIFDLNADLGTALAQEIGGHFVRVDVTDEQAVADAIGEAEGVNGKARILVNCAGIGPPAKVIDRDGNALPLASFSKIVTINLIGTFNVLSKFAAALHTAAPIGEERGVVINTASVAAYDGQIGQAAYAASKGGVVGMTLPIARELARYGIRVMTIAPGIFWTPLLATLPQEAQDSLGAQVPFPSRLGQPDEYAQLVESIVTNPMLNGETIRLDGAIRMAPR